MNTIGRNLRLSTFGESHGPAIGGIIDGFPAGFKIDFEDLYQEIAKRAPGTSLNVSQRKESDVPEFLSGISPDGITYGTPIGFIMRNQDSRSEDYSELAEKFRPNHADFTYEAKYGIRDWRGGGRASARETANWVVAGALAYQWLKRKHNVKIAALVSSIGKISYTQEIVNDLALNPNTDTFPSIPEKVRKKMDQEIAQGKQEGDSVGAVVSCIIKGLGPGIGNPVFEKLHARLAQAMMSINAAKGFEYGFGSRLSEIKGSEVLDCFRYNEKVFTDRNYSGGIQGGITNGMPIYFNVYFKPTPTIMKSVETINKNREQCMLNMKGRHDPCVALRAVPVVKALTSIVLADFLV